MQKEIEAILRKHIKCDATGLAPAVASVYLTGFEEAAAEVEAHRDQNVGGDVGFEELAGRIIGRLNQSGFVLSGSGDYGMISPRGRQAVADVLRSECGLKRGVNPAAPDNLQAHQ